MESFLLSFDKYNNFQSNNFRYNFEHDNFQIIWEAPNEWVTNFSVIHSGGFASTSISGL